MTTRRNGQHNLGVAIVGLGVGEQHALAFANDPRCTVRWLIDQDENKAIDVRSRVGVGEIATSLDAALEDPNVHIISIASFDHMHADQVLACFNSNRHVFVEKPLCRTDSELSDIMATWDEADRPHLASNLILRDADLYQWLGDEIVSGRMGKIYAIDGDYLYGRIHKITEGWRKDVPDYSVIEGGGIHLLDLMLSLTGEKPDTVACHGNNIASKNTDFNYDDFMAATYTFPSGIIGRLTANFACVHRHHHVLRVFGTEATFIYDDAGPRIHRTRDEDGVTESLAHNPLAASKGALIPAFIDAIVTNSDPAPAAKREFDLIRAIIATDKSHASKSTEEIEYTP